MTRKLTHRKLFRLEQTIRQFETRPLRYQRDVNAKSFLGTPGTDFGTVIVPRTTIPAVSRTVQAGTDDFKPGEGSAYLFKVVAGGGAIVPRLDSSGTIIFKTVYNFSSQSYAPNNPDPTVDYIGPATPILVAVMDWAGKLCIPAGAQEEASGIFFISADNGATVTIAALNTVDFNTTDLAVSEANLVQADRGLVVQVETDGGDPTIKRLNFAIDKSPLQQIVLSGQFDTTNSPVLVRDGTRNSIAFDASAGTLPPIQLAETGASTGIIDVTPRNPFHVIRDDAGPTEVDLDYADKLELKSDDGNFTVTKSNSTVTANLSGSGLPVGAVIMGTKATFTVATKEYMDRGGAADTDWALMDGTSNLMPGSGIQMATKSGTESEFFVRALSGTAAASNTRFGRDSIALTADPDEDQVEFVISDHADHFHKVDADVCDFDTIGPDAQEFQFSVADKRTTGVVDSGGSPAALTHTLTITNHQDTSGAKIEMTPDHKKLHFFERVA